MSGKKERQRVREKKNDSMKTKPDYELEAHCMGQDVRDNAVYRENSPHPHEGSV